ncbi:Fc.00g003620.m01.CDS01 [Cosmosporella sp. VM-42]
MPGLPLSSDPAYKCAGPPVSATPKIVDDRRCVEYRHGPERIGKRSKSIHVSKKTRVLPPVPPEYEYQDAVAHTLLHPATCSIQVKDNIEEKFPSIYPFVVDPALHYSQSEAGHPRLDQRAVFAALLSHPHYSWPGQVIRHMPREERNLLLYCTNKANKYVFRVSGPESLKGRPKQDIKNCNKYYDRFRIFARAWRAYTPPDLELFTDPDTPYWYSVYHPENKSYTEQPITASEICDDVHNTALAQINGKDSYVSSMENTIRELDEMIGMEKLKTFDGKRNLYLDAIKPAWDPMFRTDWRDKNIDTKVKSAKPSMQISLAYMALTFWTGQFTTTPPSYRIDGSNITGIPH